MPGYDVTVRATKICSDQFALGVPMQELGDGEGAEGDGGGVARGQGHAEDVLEPAKDMLEV